MSKTRTCSFNYIYINQISLSKLIQIQNYDSCEYLCAFESNNMVKGFVRFSNPIQIEKVKRMLSKLIGCDVNVEREKNNDQYYKSMLALHPNNIECGNPAKRRIKNVELIKQLEEKEKTLEEKQKQIEEKERDIEEKEKQIETLEEENSVITTVLRQNQDVLNNFIEAYKAAKDNDAEQMKQIMELCITIAKNTPTTTNIINATNNNNNTNNSFNLNFFLNEQCKDAMDIFEFVKGIHINLDDIMMFKNVSHAEGVTRIFDKAYKDVELQKRPIHCTDVKRETLYVRNEDRWINDETKKLIERAMDLLSNRSFRELYQWKNANPGYMESEDLMTEYSIIMRNLLGGRTDNEIEENHKKFIRNIARTAQVDKTKSLC